MKKLILVFIFSQSYLFSMTLDIHITPQDMNFKLNYIFTEPIKRFKFTFLENEEIEGNFYNLIVNEDDSIEINTDRLVVHSKGFSDVLFTGRSNFFRLEDDTCMIYSQVLDVVRITKFNGSQDNISQINYYFKDQLIHVRDAENNKSWEKYLILESDEIKTKIESNLATFSIDLDLPNRKMHVSQIQKSLSYLYEKLGKPKTKPIIFYSYKEGNEDHIYLEGRNLIHDSTILISIGSLNEPNLNSEVLPVYLYSNLYSHEIIHHCTGQVKTWMP